MSTACLRFAEITYGVQPTKRIFDVVINGQRVLTNFDIAAQAGLRAAVVTEFVIPVTGRRFGVPRRPDQSDLLGRVALVAFQSI
jgi:hypothetical protein